MKKILLVLIIGLTSCESKVIEAEQKKVKSNISYCLEQQISLMEAGLSEKESRVIVKKNYDPCICLDTLKSSGGK